MALTERIPAPDENLARSRPTARVGVALVILAAALAAPRTWAQAFPFPKPLDPAHIALADRDEAFNQHLLDTLLHDGYPGAYREVHQAFEKHPTPHIKSIYADYLLHEEAFSAPKGQIAVGIQLAQEAQKEGSIHALAVMGWEHLSGARVTRDLAAGIKELQQSADLGDSQACSYLSQAFLYGVGFTTNLFMADRWAEAAASRGNPEAYYYEGVVFEDGKTTPKDLPKACRYYFLAAQRGDGRAVEALDRLQKTNEPAALRAYYLLMLDYVSTNDVFTSRAVNQAVDYLEKHYPQDPQVLTALGLVYAFGYANNYHDPKKAKALFDQAIVLGSDDAKAYEAHMVAVGYGTKRNVPLALEMLKPLLDKNNAIAFTYYAYYHYWGLRTDDKISQDPVVAYTYAVKAQSAGSIWASGWLEMAYGFGVGTPKNYALAAKFTRIEANNHLVEYADAEHQIRKYLAFVDYK